jgi:iron complex outermembrane receptor protein
MTVDNAALTQNVTIRGIGLKSGSPRSSSGVAVYRDGVLVPPILNQTAFFDIGSVETLRGPQGTFAGSYSTGGAVYINSRDPDFNGVSGYVDTGARTYNGYGAHGAVNVPFSDTLAMRVALLGQTRDSYYDFINGGSGSPAPGGLQEFGGRVGLLWQPSVHLRALFKAEGVRREAGGRDHRPRTGGTYASLAPNNWRTLDFDTAQSTFERTARLAFRLDYKLTNGVTLRSVTGGNDNYADNVDDVDGSAGVVPGAAGSEQTQLVSERTWSQELDLISSEDRPFSWVLGAYIFRTRIDVDIDQFTSPTTGRIPTVLINIENRKGNHGFFGHGRYNFTPALQAELGARWSHWFTEDTGAIDVLDVFGPGVNLVLANDGSHSGGVVTGKAGLNWTVSDRHYLFAFAAKGFSPGTANGSGAILSPAFVANPGDNPALNQVEPETVISYETGWRSTLANGALRTQMGVFLSDYSNFQITNRNLKTGQTGALVNADSATLYGFEAQAQMAAAGFQGDVSVAAMKSRVDNAAVVDESPALVPTGPAPMRQCVPASGPPGTAGPGGCWNYAFVNVTGNTMSFAPNWTFTAGIQHSFRHRLGLLTPRLNYSFIGEQWTSIQQSTAPLNTLLGVRSILSGSLTYEQGTWRVRGFVENLTNERYVTGLFFENEFYGAPRTAGVELSRRF